MRTWALVAIALVLLLALAACDGGDSDDTPPDGATVTPIPTPTAQADDGQDFTIYEPGFHPQAGLIVEPFQGAQDGTGYFYARVRNDTAVPLDQVELTISLLDDSGYLQDRIYTRSLLGDDIPADFEFTIGSTFPLPEGFAGTDIWIRYEPATDAATTSQGFYDLPVTVAEQYPGDGEPYVYEVRGTVENNTGRELFTVPIDVVLIGPDEDIVGFEHGLTEPGLILADGDSADFEARFRFVAVDPALISEVRVFAAGYAALE